MSADEKECPPGLKAIYKFLFTIIAAILVTFIAWSSQCLIDHGTRLSVIETKFGHIQENLLEMKDMIKEIRQEQIRRYKKESGQR